jgi:hypothetical protein
VVKLEYVDKAKKAYGSKCEFENCGWEDAQCDVHHINYKEQQDYEKTIRKAIKEDDVELTNKTIMQANKRGFLFFNYQTMQLTKDDRINNLAVLCPNHHRYVHSLDLGMDILNRIPKRKKNK